MDETFLDPRLTAASFSIESAVRKYGPEIFRFLATRDIALFLSLRNPDHALSNRLLALLLFQTSSATRERVLGCLDTYRRPMIQGLLEEFEPNAANPAGSQEAGEAFERLIRGLVSETTYGRIRSPVFPVPKVSELWGAVIESRPWKDIPEPFPRGKGRLRLLKRDADARFAVGSPVAGEIVREPLFDYLTATPDACIGFWAGLLKKMRDAGTAPLAEAADRLDPFSRSLALLILEHREADEFHDFSRRLHEAERARIEAYYRRVAIFFEAFSGDDREDATALRDRLLAASPGMETLKARSCDIDAPFPDFHPRMEPAGHVRALEHMLELARARGLLALEDYADNPQGKCPVMVCGLSVLCASSDEELLREAVRLKSQTMMADWERRASMVMTALSPKVQELSWFAAFTLMEAHLTQCRDVRDYLR